MTSATALSGGSTVRSAAAAAAAAAEIAGELGSSIDQLGGYGDLDKARAVLDAPLEVLEALWQKVDDLAKHGKIQPELRRSILRVAAQVDPGLVEQLKHELDEATPSAVLEAHEAELVADRLTLGAFPVLGRLTAPSIGAWLREDPRRLRGMLGEASRFGADDRRVVESVLQLAKDAGIDLTLAGDVVSHALMDARRPEAVAR
jgi:hypothetical protein